jgi:dTDP-4-dehydrorhamnose 3,5-epimerase
MSFFKNVVHKPLTIYQHPKGGYVIEGWRTDQDKETAFIPEMMYLSYIPPGEKRGPHEHVDQTDYFVFAFAGVFDITLWEVGHPDIKSHFHAGEHNPSLLIVPPGIVHAYHNIAKVPGLVINLPDRLYKGFLKQDKEDIIRHEDNPENKYVF